MLLTLCHRVACTYIPWHAWIKIYVACVNVPWCASPIFWGYVTSCRAHYGADMIVQWQGLGHYEYSLGGRAFILGNYPAALS